ncbi:hypothetical protein HDU77_001776 [Chytriomyces hyalinus]|nr:hypothetical protein HDU77_001776 [Chytriomyces hyalinus]
MGGAAPQKLSLSLPAKGGPSSGYGIGVPMPPAIGATAPTGASTVNAVGVHELLVRMALMDEPIDPLSMYAVNTFVASLDGQVSVIKGDALALLDDSNSYWWLVRCRKTDEIGYIPAENIETPFERLARLNEKRNVILGCLTEEDAVAGPVPVSHSKRIVFAPTIEIFEEFDLFDDSPDDEDFAEGRNYPSSDAETDAESIYSPQDELASPTIMASTESSNSPSSAVDAEEPLSSPKSPLKINTSPATENGPLPESPNLRKQSIGGLLHKVLKHPSVSVVSAKPLVPSPVTPIQNQTSMPPIQFEKPGLNDQQQPQQSDKPTINVLRVYAGNVDLQATFKTIELKPDTTTLDVLKSVLTRFKLQSHRAEDYYLSVLHMDSLEKRLPDDAIMQQVIEALQRKKLPGVSSIHSSASRVREWTRSDGTVVSRVSMNDDKIIKVIVNKKKLASRQEGKSAGGVAALPYAHGNQLLLRIFMEVEDKGTLSVVAVGSGGGGGGGTTTRQTDRIYKTISVGQEQTVKDVLEIGRKKFASIGVTESVQLQLCSLLHGAETVLEPHETVASILQEVQDVVQEADFLMRAVGTHDTAVDSSSLRTPPRSPSMKN